MIRNSSTSRDTRYPLILSQEEAFAKAVAIRVIDRPVLSAWMILIPITFVFYMFRYQKFRAGAEEFTRGFTYTKRLALDAASDSIKRGVQKNDAIRHTSSLYDKKGIADEPTGVRQKQKKEIDLLFDHYNKLLKAKGDSYDSLVKHAYTTAANYKRFTERLRKAENDVMRAVIQDFGHEEEYPPIIAKIKAAVEDLRKEELDRIFYSR